MLFVNARYVLLTYSQSGDLDPFRVVDHLSALGAECIIARENHKVRGVHLHAFVDFDRKFRSRNVRIFDVDNKHPNISPSRGTPEKGFDYAIKDGEVVAGGLERPQPRGGMSTGSGSIRNLGPLCESVDEFLGTFAELDFDQCVKSFTNARAFADWYFRPEPERYSNPSGAVFSDPELDGRAEWLRQSRIGLGDPHIGGGEFRGGSGLRPAGLLNSVSALVGAGR